METKAELQVWWVLVIVNHVARRYNVRFEATPGTGKNSLTAYIWWMTRSIGRIDAGQIKEHPFWGKFWREVLSDVVNVEQYVFARIEASSREDLQHQYNATVKSLKDSYRRIGYSTYASKVNEPEEAVEQE